MALAQTEQAEVTRRVLRHVAEAVRRIEERHHSSTRLEAIFSPELLTLRTRLRELTLRLVTIDPVQLGTKALEVHWRKAYHEPVALARQLREGGRLSKVERALVEAHLAAGVGHYHHAITTIVHQCAYTPPLALDFSISPACGFGFSAPAPRRSREQGEAAGWAEGAVVRCLVWLGDIGRYLAELCDGCPSLPARYYSVALRLRPDTGLPYSQLGTLCGERNHGLDQLYHYLRSAACTQGAEGGEANLKRFLEKAETKAGGTGSGALVVGSLVKLVAVVMSRGEQEAVTLACQESLALLHQLLEQEGAGGGGLEGPWLPMMVASLVCLQARLAREERDHRLALCQAWLLALLSHLASRLVATVGGGLWGEGWMPPVPHLKEVEKEQEPKVQDQGKKRKNKLEEMLRRRKRSGSEDDASDDGSEGEDIFDSDSEEELSDRSDLLDSSGSDSDSELDVVVEEEQQQTPSEWDLVVAAEASSLLPPIRLLLLWLAAPMAEGVLAQTGPGSEQLWTNLASLCSVLTSGPREGRLVACDKVARMQGEGGVLPEDWLVRGLVGKEGVDWGREARPGVHGVARLEWLEKSRDWLCGHRDSKIAWSEEQGLAFLRKEEDEKQERVQKKEKMKHMAELWLRQEVQQLEQEAVQERLVVVDGLTMAHGLATLRRVVSLRHCTLLVPAIAVQQLDSLKRTERGAREAIRWLERELGRGNSHLRAQGEGEARKLEGLEVPKQRERSAWERVQLLECVAHLLHTGASVTLVTEDTAVLSGEAELPQMEGEWRVEDLQSFQSRQGGGGRRRGRGKLGSPADKESSKG